MARGFVLLPRTAVGAAGRQFSRAPHRGMPLAIVSSLGGGHSFDSLFAAGVLSPPV